VGETERIRAGAGLSTDPVAAYAARAAAGQAARELDGSSCDLAFVFASPHHTDAFEQIVRAVRDELNPGTLLGCNAIWIVGGAREVEDSPAVSVWAAHLPDTEIVPFSLSYERAPDGDAYLGWPDAIPDGAAVIAIADPYTFPADAWLERMNELHPGTLVIGGMASGGRAPGESRLVSGDEVLWYGCVGAMIAGRVSVRALVSQGCKPVGEPYSVTGADRNVLLTVGGRPPLERLKETFASSDETDRRAMQTGLHVGRVVDEYKTEFRRGDFLVRNVVGADEESGAIAVGDQIRLGETVQFHVRDATSADTDLREMVKAVERPAGALMFTCNGRGTRFFGVDDHDASIVAETLGPAIAGFFAAGELGPVGGKNYLHGFTASLALFYDTAR
jgi:small ligand-binding sensory domain FIST